VYTLEFQLESFFFDLYMNILFHVLSEALEDSPFVYGIACCCMSGWWLCVTTVLTSNVSVCCSI